MTTVSAERQANAEMSMSRVVSIREMLPIECNHLEPKSASTCDRWRDVPEQNTTRSLSLEFLSKTDRYSKQRFFNILNKLNQKNILLTYEQSGGKITPTLPSETGFLDLLCPSPWKKEFDSRTRELLRRMSSGWNRSGGLILRPLFHLILGQTVFARFQDDQQGQMHTQ